MLNPYQILFEKVFIVSVPSYMVDEINGTQSRGRYMSEDDDTDLALAQELRDIGMTVDKMVDCYELGIPITLKKNNEIREIYNALEDHLAKIKDVELNKGQSLNRVRVKRDEIAMLDSFSGMLSVKYPGVIEKDIDDENNAKVEVSLYDLVFGGPTAQSEEGPLRKVDMSEVLKED